MGRYAYVSRLRCLIAPDQLANEVSTGSAQIIPALARSQLARTAQLDQPSTRAHRRLGQPVQRPIAAVTPPVGAFLRHATRLRHDADAL